MEMRCWHFRGQIRKNLIIFESTIERHFVYIAISTDLHLLHKKSDNETASLNQGPFF